MKAFLILAGLAFTGLAISGEDSTDHWGAGGTGPAWYDTPCGLAQFPGPLPYPENQRCASTKSDSASRKEPADRSAKVPAGARVSTAPTSER
jgi:hypothetical protein